MWDTPGRLLRLLELLQQRREWGGAELAERLGVSTRTVRRDVDRLRAIGYPVDARYGADGGYRLAPGTSLPPLMFDAAEAVATVLALRSASTTADPALAEATMQALTKLVGVMPRRLRAQVEALAEQVQQTDAGTIRGSTPATVPVETLTTAAVACRERRRTTARRGTEELLLDPLRLVHAGQGWFLVAYDVTAGAWAALRLDQLGDVVATDRPAGVREPPAEDLTAYVVAQLGTEIQQVQAVVEVAAPAAAVEPWIDPAFGTVEPLTDDTCVVRCGADTLSAVARWLLLLDAELTIVEPAELAQEYERLAATVLRYARTHRG
ncbi:helix-turn-helix transcriptional regulator [Pseudonocardia sp. CA-107938]|uniref:helix-turn-helix transcriptional regulator n=1 Tax=Pseudonocardia sp. CA-107938 TaxID=3240021 RepID=UPI003D912C2F